MVEFDRMLTSDKLISDGWYRARMHEEMRKHSRRIQSLDGKNHKQRRAEQRKEDREHDHHMRKVAKNVLEDPDEYNPDVHRWPRSETEQIIGRAMRSVDHSPDRDFKCRNCGESGCELQCSKCRSARYCGKKCQIADWQRHKLKCQKK